MKRGLFIVTYGCQMNQYDSTRIRERLAASHEMVADPAEADLIVINTCSVREKPQQKVLTELGRLRPLKARNPHLKIVVAGCVAQQERTALLERAAHLDLVLGPDHIDELPALLLRLEAGERLAVTNFESGAFSVAARPVAPDFGEEGQVSAFIAVQKGCNHFCSYCIVPHVRGREKSRDMKEILDEVRAYAAHGAREVTLLGQNINGYGLDLDQGTDFADLLNAVAEVESIARIRFVTSHPAVFTARHIAAMAAQPKVCRYLHLPFQAGSDRILAAMKRGYTRAQYLDLVARLRAAMPDLALTTDIIVGFPGETEEDFAETLTLLRAVNCVGTFSFIYSPRPHTAAEKLDDPVPGATKLAWLARLQEEQKHATRRANEALLGSEQEVLVEGYAKRDLDLSGRTRCNKIVNFPAPKELLGSLVRLRISAAYQNSLRGELL